MTTYEECNKIKFTDWNEVTIDGHEYHYYLGIMKDMDIDVERYNKITGRIDSGGVRGSQGFGIDITDPITLYNFVMFFRSIVFSKIQGKIVYVLVDVETDFICGFLHTDLYDIEDPRYILISQSETYN